MKTNTAHVTARTNAITLPCPVISLERGLVLEWNCENQSVTRFDLYGKPIPFENSEGPLRISIPLSEREFLESARFFARIFGYRLVERVTKTKGGFRVSLSPRQ